MQSESQPVELNVEEKDPRAAAIAGYERLIREIEQVTLPLAISDGCDVLVSLQKEMHAEATANRARLVQQLQVLVPA